MVIRFALSRKREFLADAGSVELTKNPDAMISALRKIENRGELQGATSAVMEMCIDNPREGFADLFATHPSVDKRVDALVRYRRRPRSGAARRCRNSTMRNRAEERTGRRRIAGQPQDRRRPAVGPASGGTNRSCRARPPIELGAPTAATAPTARAADPGPWGPHGGSR